jgi:branched-chain amino acid transport system substrate-binding protein
MVARGIKSAALTYTNNDYGKGLAESIAAAFTAKGGTITISAAHEDGKADYAAEVAALAAAGGDLLIVAGYLDQGGAGIIQAALDTGAFSLFELPGGMIGTSMDERFGAALNGSFGQIAGSDSSGAATLQEMAKAAGWDGTSAYAPESYDAAALFALAMEAAKSTDPAVYKDHVMAVANGPGEKIFPGELAKGLEILKSGGTVDYEGATAVTLIGPGESAGRYREIEVKDGVQTTVGFR